MSSMQKNLAEPKGTRAMAELNPWLFLADDDQTIVCKDSSLLAIFTIEGVDCESTDAFGVQDAAKQLDVAMRRAARDEVRVWHRADRYVDTTYQYGQFEDPVAQAIDEAWGATFTEGTVFRTRQILSISMPTQKKARTSAELIRERIDEGQSAGTAILSALRDKFWAKDNMALGFATKDELVNAMLRFEQNILRPFVSDLNLFKIKRLGGSELRGMLRSMTSTREDTPLDSSFYGYLDSLCSETWIDNKYRDHLVFEGRERSFAAVVSLKDAPGADKLAALDTLLALPMRITVASCFKSATNSDSISELKSARTYDEMRNLDIKSLIRSVASGGGDDVMSDDQEPTTEVGRAVKEHLQDIKNGATAWGHMAASVTVYAPDLPTLERHLERVNRVLQNKELNFLREREGMLSAFTVGIPGQLIDVVRWFHVEASNVTDLCPNLISLASGEAHHPYFTGIYGTKQPPLLTMRSRYGTALSVCAHVGAVGHQLFIGPNRAGKTLAKMFMTAQFLKYRKSKSIIIDKDRSCRAATLMLGGKWFDLSPGAQQSARTNPVSYIKKPGGRAFLVGWLDRLMSMRGVRLTDKQITDVTVALDHIKGMDKPTLSSLWVQLPTEELKERLAPWVGEGVYAEYFDNEEDEIDFLSVNVTCFEVNGLLSKKLDDVIRAFTDYVFFRVIDMLQPTEANALAEVTPTEIYMEEAGFLLNDPIFSERAVDYLMTLAKLHAFLVMTAQSPEPFLQNARLKASIRDNIGTVFFLPNARASGVDLGSKYKEVFGVNDNHLELISNMQPKKEYGIWHPQTEEFRIGVLALPKEVVACLMSDKSTDPVLSQMYDSNDDSWRERYAQRILEMIS